MLDILPPGEFHAPLTAPQKAAIKNAISIGRQIQADFPQIQGMFLSGATLEQINQLLQISSKYHTTAPIAIAAIQKALQGYAGQMCFSEEDKYAGLLSASNYQKTAKAHVVAGVRQQMRQKIGIHGQTPEERREICKKGAEACGKTIWSEEEKAQALGLSDVLKTKTGTRVSLKKIAAILNQEYHAGKGIRTGRSVGKIIQRVKEQ